MSDQHPAMLQLYLPWAVPDDKDATERTRWYPQTRGARCRRDGR